jgi:hypothetical protein
MADGLGRRIVHSPVDCLADLEAVVGGRDQWLQAAATR